MLGTAHLGRERQKLTAVCWVAVLGTALLDESIALLQCINPLGSRTEVYIGDPPRLGRQRQLNATPHSRPPSQFSLLIHDDNHDDDHDDHDDDGHEDDGHNDDDHDDDGDDEGDVKEGTGGPGADHSVGDSVNRRQFSNLG